MEKILLVKFGWSEFYQGGPVNGNYEYLNGGNEGAESWAFEPDQDGKFYVYTPPLGRYRNVPSSDYPNDWKVFCVSRRPGHNGLFLVGWFEGASLIGEMEERSVTSRENPDHVLAVHPYSIIATGAHFVPPQARVLSFSRNQIRSSPYYYLSGPGVGCDNWRIDVANTLKMIADKSLGVVEVNVDPLRDFSAEDRGLTPFLHDSEIRQKVEKSAVSATISLLKNEGFKCTSVESLNIGYDIHAVNESGEIFFVEVKGTSQESPRFFLTRNEFRMFENNVSGWRLAIVTSALSDNPIVELYTREEVSSKFDVEPFSWFASPKVQVYEL